MADGDGNGGTWERRIRNYLPLVFYVIAIVWGAATVRSDINQLRTEMTRATTAIQDLTRSFDREGANREARIRELERRVDRIELAVLRTD